MYSLFGLSENVKTLYTLAYRHSQAPIKSATDLQNAFGQFLKSFQPGVQRLPPGMLFTNDPGTDHSLASLFVLDPLRMDRGQTTMIGEPYPPLEKQRRVEIVRAALEHLRERQPNLYLLFTLAINVVFFYDSTRAIGGSTSNGLGVIWLVGGDHFTVYDYAELLLHELTHSLLNIDEARYGHYDYIIAQRPESYAISAIMKVPRPIHKVVHTIVVSTELVLARRSFLPQRSEVTVHLSTDEIESNARDALNSVMQLSNLTKCVTPRILAILEACRAALDGDTLSLKEATQ
jgi:hypothetical protein